MSSNNVYNLIIASSGDIGVEKKIVREICWGFNQAILHNHHKLCFQVRDWDTVFPSAENAQNIVRRLSDECDILVCLFHKKFGDPSDSLKQFLASYDLWKSLKKPSILSFFKAAKVSSLEELRDPQLLHVLELKDKIEKNSSMISEAFSAPNEFCEKVQDTLHRWVNNNVKRQ